MQNLNFKTLLTAFFLCTFSSTAVLAEGAKTYQMDELSTTAEVTAKVKSIDYKTRNITLEEGGKAVSFVAGKDVANFNEIKKGDNVKIFYQEGLAYTINKGGMAKEAQEVTEVKKGRPGERPAGEAMREVKATVVITKIDKKVPSVTFKTAKGETQTVKVQHPERLEGVKVGDSVDLTYTQAMAIKVEKQSKM